MMKLLIEVEIPQTEEAVHNLFSHIRLFKNMPPIMNDTVIKYTGVVRDDAFYVVSENSEYLLGMRRK
jgi:hypothetical protein